MRFITISDIPAHYIVRMYYFEPYKSCSLFGALRYVANIRNSVCLIHGPSGCSFFNRNGIIRLNGYYSSPIKIDIPKIFTTGFNERDAIFGAEEKLKKAIDELVEKFKPEVMFVLNCCVTEITGENIDDICRRAQEKYSIPIVPVHSAGFKGDHRVGMHLAADLLFNNFMRDKAPVRPNSVNIIADFDYFNNTSVEVTQILHRIGVQDILHVPGKCSVEELRTASGASVNLVACGFAGKRLAEMFRKTHGIPYVGVGVDFYGIEKSYELYSQICDFFQADQSWLLEMKQDYMKQLEAYKPFFQGKRAFIVAGMRRTVGYSEILKELGVSIDFIFSECDPTEYKSDLFTKYSTNIMCNDPAMELYDRVEREKPDFILSTLSELIAPHPYITRTDEDFAGFSGAVRMAQYLKENLPPEKEPLFVGIQN